MLAQEREPDTERETDKDGDEDHALAIRHEGCNRGCGTVDDAGAGNVVLGCNVGLLESGQEGLVELAVRLDLAFELLQLKGLAAYAAHLRFLLVDHGGELPLLGQGELVFLAGAVDGLLYLHLEALVCFSEVCVCRNHLGMFRPVTLRKLRHPSLELRLGPDRFRDDGIVHDPGD